MADKDLRIFAKIEGAPDAKSKLDLMRDAIVNFGDDGKRAAQGLTDRMEDLDREADKLYRRIQSGSPPSQLAISRLALKYQELEREMKEAFRDVDKAPKEAKDAYDQLGKNVDLVTKDFNRLNKELEDHKQTTRQTSTEVHSLSDAIDKQLGKHAQLAGKIGLVGTTAIGTYSATRSFFESLGKDYSLVDEMFTNLGRRMMLFTQGIADSIIGMIPLFQAANAAMKGDLDTAEVRLEQYRQTQLKAMNDIKVAFAGTNKEVRDHAGLLEETKKKIEELSPEQKKLADIIADGEQKLWALNQELEKLKKALDDSTEASLAAQVSLSDASVAQRNAAMDVSQLNEQLAEQTRKADELARQYGESDPMVRKARDTQAELANQLQFANQQLERSKEELKKATEEHEKAEKAAEQYTEKITANETATKNTELATRLHAAATQENVMKQVEAKMAAGDVQGAMILLAKAMSDAKKPTEDAAAGLISVKDGATGAKMQVDLLNTTDLTPFVTKVLEAKKAVDELRDSAGQAASAINGITTAGDDEGGETTGGGGGGGWTGDGGGSKNTGGASGSW